MLKSFQRCSDIGRSIKSLFYSKVVWNRIENSERTERSKTEISRNNPVIIMWNNGENLPANRKITGKIKRENNVRFFPVIHFSKRTVKPPIFYQIQLFLEGYLNFWADHSKVEWNRMAKSLCITIGLCNVPRDTSGILK